MNKIVRKIHQTWKDSDVPDHLIPIVETWKKHHRDWEYKLWTDAANRDFIAKYHPDFLHIYDNYPFPIQRVDAVRYFILYEEGGIFVDLDFECLQNTEPLLESNNCIFGLEPEEHCSRLKKKRIICNAFMASSPKNSFFYHICSELKKGVEPFPEPTPDWLKVLNTTGPFKLTSLYDSFENKKEIKLLPSKYLYPLNIDETRIIIKNPENIKSDLQEKINDAYAIHYFLGSWW